MSVKISIIIPCYNHGIYIHEAIDSVEQCADKSLYEIIIINDGSTDDSTMKVLNELKQEGYFIIDQTNQGLASARNNAIKLAKGKYILPLDSDNRIRPDYIYKSIDILEKKKDIAVVYGDKEYFGEQQGRVKVGKFVLEDLMLMNYIDACAVYRKELWEKLGGYDGKNPVMGVEDWEFWLRAAFAGYQFYYIPEILFDYRVSGNSMIRQVDTKEKMQEQFTYVFKKHAYYYYHFYRKYYLTHKAIFRLGGLKRFFKAFLHILNLYTPPISRSFLEENDKK